jgi:hypothetical protein
MSPAGSAACPNSGIVRGTEAPGWDCRGRRFSSSHGEERYTRFRSVRTFPSVWRGWLKVVFCWKEVILETESLQLFKGWLLQRVVLMVGINEVIPQRFFWVNCWIAFSGLHKPEDYLGILLLTIKKLYTMGTVAHTYNPSCLGGSHFKARLYGTLLIFPSQQTSRVHVGFCVFVWQFKLRPWFLHICNPSYAWSADGKIVVWGWP